jgi:hypothetical protein
MKRIALIVGMFFIAATMYAQGVAPLAKGEKQLNFGLGSSNYGIPAYVGMDFAIHDDITLGPVVKVRIAEDISFGLLGRGDYHFNRVIGIPGNFDFYAGASVGFFTGNDSGLDIGIQVGGRWYWSDKWGLNVEIGGGTGYGTSVGLSMKM